MLNFSKIFLLQEHYTFLENRLWIHDFFLVGGAIRDLLLGINDHPQDIDFTMAGNPLELYEHMNKSDFSHFITEKYGTMTFIPKENSQLKYELTPFRAESGYQDVRHPDQIFWSDDLFLDMQRRDFKMNAIYYRNYQLRKPLYETSKMLNDDQLFWLLAREGFVYLENQATLIVQKESYLRQLVIKGKLDSDFLYYLLDMQPCAYLYGENTELVEHSQEQSLISLNILIDPADGLGSIWRRKLETVGDPDKRFQEDALRLLRALRFVNVVNEKLLQKGKMLENKDPKNKIRLFDFSTETWKSIKKNHTLLEKIAKERIYQELFKTFNEWSPFGLVGLLDEAEMLPLIFPALAKTKHYDQPIRYHPFDIYAHTLLTLWHLQQLNSNYLVRFAMLYHDVGKVGQYAKYGLDLTKEEIREILAGPLNHRFSSGELMEEDFRKIWFSNKEIQEIKRYIREHHTPWEILLSNPSHWWKKLKKLFSEAGYEKLQNLLDINIADRLGMYNPLQNASDLSDAYYLKELLDQINQDEGQFKKSDLAISGADIMKHFDLMPGKLVGELLQVAFDWVIGDAKNRNVPKQIFANLTNYLKHKK